jgi:hypothetical protein
MVNAARRSWVSSPASWTTVFLAGDYAVDTTPSDPLEEAVLTESGLTPERVVAAGGSS